jgi:hypothetical protein
MCCVPSNRAVTFIGAACAKTSVTPPLHGHASSVVRRQNVADQCRRGQSCSAYLKQIGQCRTSVRLPRTATATCSPLGPSPSRLLSSFPRAAASVIATKPRMTIVRRHPRGHHSASILVGRKPSAGCGSRSPTGQRHSCGGRMQAHLGSATFARPLTNLTLRKFFRAMAEWTLRGLLGPPRMLAASTAIARALFTILPAHFLALGRPPAQNLACSPKMRCPVDFGGGAMHRTPRSAQDRISISWGNA